MKVPSISTIMKNTAFKDKLTAKAAQEALKWLEAGAPHKYDGLPGDYTFDMGHFISKSYNCSTTCCMAGAISLYKRKGFIQGTFFGDDICRAPAIQHVVLQL